MKIAFPFATARRVFEPFFFVRSLLLTTVAAITFALPQNLFATANYVYHERTGNNPGCGANPYVDVLNPSSSQAVNFCIKVEYQFFTDNVRVYYTTDGSAPAGSFGAPSGTTQVAVGSFSCTFGVPVVDVWNAAIPAQPAGTTVKYIVSAWHSGGGPEVFGNSGTCSECTAFTSSSEATLFQYTVCSTPTINCPGNIVQSADSGVCSAVVSWPAPTTTGTPAPTVICTPASGSTFNVGTSTVNCSAQNACGSASCSFTVTINDTEAPTIVCSTNIVVGTDSGLCSAVVSYIMTSADNCPGQVVNQTMGLPSGSEFPKGITTNTFVVTDTSGNTATCSFTITVNDLQPPILNVPTNITQNTDPGFCSAVMTYSVSSTDNCPGQNVTQIAGLPSGSAFPRGTTTNIFVATDPSGNATTNSFTVTIVGSVAPEITCPGNLIAIAAAGQCATNVSYTVLVTNSCGAANIVCLPPSGSAFPIGTNHVSCTVTDEAEHNSTCGFDVIVLLGATASASVNAGVPDASVVGLASAMNVSTPIGSISKLRVKLNLANGYNGDLYAYLVHDSGFSVLLNRVGKTLIDSFGYGDAGFNITLDDQAPNGDIHKYQNVTVPSGPLTGTWAPDGRDIDPAFVTDFDPRTALLSSFQGVNPNGQWILFVADLVAGDVSTLVSWELDIEGTFAAPAITNQLQSLAVECSQPAAFNVSATGSQPLYYQWYFGGNPIPNATNATFAIASANGTNSGNYFVVVTNGYCSGGAAITSAVAVLNVQDTTPPTLGVPGNLVLTADLGHCSKSNVLWSATASDVCDGTVIVSCVPTSGSTFPVGTTLVTCTTTDSSGNSTNRSFSVTVNDTQAPVITCPSDLVAAASVGQCSVPVTFSVGATDNCGTPIVICVPPSGSSFAIGTNHVTCTATDGSGNSNPCGFNIVVLLADTKSASVNLPVPDSSIIGLASVMNVSTPIGRIDKLQVKLNITNGYNGDLYVYLVHDSGFSILLNRVGKTLADSFGYGDAGFNIALDDQAPNGDIHKYQNVVTPIGPLTGVWAPDGRNVDPATVTDLDSRTALLSSFQGLDPNGQWVLFIADRAGGDVSTLVSWELDIQGTFAAPSITNQPQSLAVECGQPASFGVQVTGSSPLGYQWYFAGNPIPGATNATLTFTAVNGTNAGNYFVVITNGYCSNGGAVTSQVATLTVNDTVAPVIVCSSNLVFAADTGQCSKSNVTWSISVSDSCDPAPVVMQLTGLPSGSTFPKGVTTNTFKVTDANGNMSTCSFTVTVNDTQPPAVSAGTIASCYSTIAAAEADAIAATIASDNCGVPTKTASTVGTCNALITVTATDSSGNQSSVAYSTIIDSQIPVIGTITAMQSAIDVKNCANTTVQGVVTVSVQANDNCGLLGSRPFLTLTNGLASDTPVFVNESPAGTFNYIWTVTAATSNGTWGITVLASDMCNASAANFTLCVNKSQLSGTVEMDTLRGGTYSFNRVVTFIATDNLGNQLRTWNVTVGFTNNGSLGIASATYSLGDVPGGLTRLSAKTAWSLRKRLPATLDSNGQGIVSFSAVNKLRGGDLNGNNVVNLADYNVLSLNWLQFAPVADINGDTVVNIADYNILRLYYLTGGDGP